MFAFIKKLLGYPTEAEKAAAQDQTAAQAPYKVEAPVVEVPVSMPVGTPPAVPEETAPIITKVVESKPEKVKAKKKPAAKKPASEKKPRAPRKPKSQKS